MTSEQISTVPGYDPANDPAAANISYGPPEAIAGPNDVRLVMADIGAVVVEDCGGPEAVAANPLKDWEYFVRRVGAGNDAEGVRMSYSTHRFVDGKAAEDVVTVSVDSAYDEDSDHGAFITGEQATSRARALAALMPSMVVIEDALQQLPLGNGAHFRLGFRFESAEGQPATASVGWSLLRRNARGMHRPLKAWPPTGADRIDLTVRDLQGLVTLIRQGEIVLPPEEPETKLDT